MAGRSTKPYSTPKRTVKKSSTSKKSDKEKKDLDVTTRIRVDEVRINDAESLDTSFLEGRSEKKVNKNTKKVKSNILNEKKNSIDIFNIIKVTIYFLFSIAIIGIIVFFIWNNFGKIETKKVKDSKSTVIKNSNDKNKVIVDRNYLFVGDFYTDDFSFDDFDLDYHYVKSSDKELTTNSLLSDIESMVYIYNPSIVFINIGFNDIDSGEDIDSVIENIDEVIDLIKNNRSYADIYIESLYPINTNVEDFDNSLVNNIDNDTINKFNKELITLSKKMKVNYLDVYSMLEKDNELDSDYTDDGVNLNEDGYKQVLKVINKVID